MPQIPERFSTVCRAPSAGSESLRVLGAAVIGYFYFGYWFSRMRA